MSKPISTNPQHRKSNTNWPEWRIKMHNIIFEADTPAGKLFDIVLLVLIILSIFVMMMETVESFDQKYHQEIQIAEWVLTIAFTVEYIARLLSVKKPLSYAKSFYGIVDFLAILPAYLSIFIPGGQGFVFIRALRIMRVFRILKLARYSNASNSISKAMVASRYKITVFMIFVITLVTIIGSIMYYIESPHNDGFSSIPKSIYWAIVTITTVGYGDISPTTPIGQFLSSLIMLIGYGIIAVPTGIVTSELASQKQSNTHHELNNNEFNTACINCGAEGHLNNAEFCFKCGHSLDHND